MLSGGDEVYVHEKKLALYPRGELVIEYSLIAFFHWYVAGYVYYNSKLERNLFLIKFLIVF